jgi:hypothetical protein
MDVLNNRFDAEPNLAENESRIEKIKLCMAKYPSLEELQQGCVQLSDAGCSGGQSFHLGLTDGAL